MRLSFPNHPLNVHPNVASLLKMPCVPSCVCGVNGPQTVMMRPKRLFYSVRFHRHLFLQKNTQSVRLALKISTFQRKKCSPITVLVGNCYCNRFDYCALFIKIDATYSKKLYDRNGARSSTTTIVAFFMGWKIE